MVEKSQDIEMDKSVAVGNVENNSENTVYVIIVIRKIKLDSRLLYDKVKPANDQLSQGKLYH